MNRIEFVGEACDDDWPSVRDMYEDVARAHLRRNGIEPGRRAAGDDPQATYQSDMIDDEVGNIHMDPARWAELAGILEDALPRGLAALVAEAAHTMTGYWTNKPEAVLWRDDVDYIIRSHLDREAGL